MSLQQNFRGPTAIPMVGEQLETTGFTPAAESSFSGQNLTSSALPKLGKSDPAVQRKSVEEEQTVQRKTKDDEKVMMKPLEEEQIQRKEEDEKVMMKPLEEEQIQRKEEHEKVMMKPLEEEQVQRKPLEEEKVMRAVVEDEKVQRKEAGAVPTVTNSFQSSVDASKGQGTKLDGATNDFMSSKFGTDFNEVAIHKDKRAHELASQIHARAFTVGNDIYFNEGEYQPTTSKGKHLLAHELTHVVQQNEGKINRKEIQRSCYSEYEYCVSTCKKKIPDSNKKARALCYAQCADELGRCVKEQVPQNLPEVESPPWWVYGLGLLAAGALVVADGPFPFGDAAAASLLISLGIISE
jgi:hypothetical protein